MDVGDRVIHRYKSEGIANMYLQYDHFKFAVQGGAACQEKKQQYVKLGTFYVASLFCRLHRYVGRCYI